MGYNMNKRLDESQEIYEDMNTNNHTNNNDGQIGTMEAWSLLQSIQQNLASIDGDMNAINNDRGHRKKKNRKQQLKHIKSKTRQRGKRKKTKEEFLEILKNKLIF